MSGNRLMMQNLVGDRGVTHGADPYRGEGTIATAGEYHNALEPFLGPPTKRLDAEPHHQFPHEAWFLPDAYSGRNEYIRETIVQMVINYNAFMTREILPWREQNNPNIAWDSIKFDKTLVDMEPEQGIPRYVTVEREAHSDYMVRRGLALIVNHGFAATPGGQKDFMYKVATIAGAVQETCDQAGVVALLRSKNEYRKHIVDSMKSASDSYDLFHHELWRFGIVQHTERGWYHMDAEAQHVMRQENIQPDCWIVPPRMTSYAAMGQLAETEVYRAGELTARSNLLKGEDNFATFRGKSVYEIKPYTLDVDGRTVDPLNRARMIGDFFVVPYYDIRRDGNGPMYPVGQAGRTQVYCCDTDRFETFSWKAVAARAFESAEDDMQLQEHIGCCTYGKDGPPEIDTRNFLERLIGGISDFVGSIGSGIGGMFSSSRLGPSANSAASAKVRSAVLLGLHQKFPTLKDAEDPRQAMLTHAKPLVDNGMAPAAATAAMINGIHHYVAQHLDTTPHLTEDLLANESVSEIHDAYVQGGVSGSPMDVHMDRVVASGAFPNPLQGALGKFNEWSNDFEAWKETTIGDGDGDEDLKHLFEAMDIFDQNYEKIREAMDDPNKMIEVVIGLISSMVDLIVKKLLTVNGKDTLRGKLIGRMLKYVIKEIKYRVTKAVRESFHLSDAQAEKFSDGMAHKINASSVDTAGMVSVKHKMSDAEADRATHLTMNNSEGGDKHTHWEDGVYDILCFRPFRQYVMGTGVLCKKGNELGNTFRGWADFQLTDNVIAKTHIGHFTFWHCSVVTNPRCLFLAEDIFCTNYMSGEGREVLSWSERDEFKSDPLGTMTKHGASIVALPVPIGALNSTDRRLQLNNPISLTGCLDPTMNECSGHHSAGVVHIGDYASTGKVYETMEELLKLYERKQSSMSKKEVEAEGYQEPHSMDSYRGYSGPTISAALDGMWGFSGMNHDVDYEQSNTFQTNNRLINHMGFHTMQKFQNPTSLRWEVSNLNSGHFGENGVYEGVKRIRCGFLDYFKDMEYAKAMAMGGLNV